MRTISNMLFAASVAVGFANSAVAQPSSVEWRYLTVLPKSHAYQVPIDQAIERIEQRTEGRINIVTFYAGELPYRSPEFLRVMHEGKAEMVFLSQQVVEGMPLLAASGLPFLSPNGTFEEQNIVSDIVKEVAQKKLAEEFDAKLLARFWWPPQAIFSKTPIESIEDIKGMQIRASGKELAEALALLGANPVAVDSSEVYQALARNTIDAAVTGASNVLSFKMYEVTEYIYTQPTSHVESSIAVSNTAWNALSEQDQNIVMEELIKGHEAATDVSRADDEAIKVLVAEHGMKVNHPPAGERERIRAMMAPVWDGWAARTGADGQELLPLLKKAFGQ